MNVKLWQTEGNAMPGALRRKAGIARATCGSQKALNRLDGYRACTDSITAGSI